MKNLLKRLITMLVSDNNEASTYRMHPIAKNGSFAYYDMDSVLNVLEDPKLPDDYRTVFKQVIEQMVIFEQAELIPIAIHDIENNIINITSRELLEGRFIQ